MTIIVMVFQELQEFEIAPFIDQAKYIRVFYPQSICKTHQINFPPNFKPNSMAE
jgi:hypothetical protein